MQNVSNIQYDKTRKFERKPFSQIINYSVSPLDFKERKWVNLTGNAIDISETGIGIRTDYPLEAGHMLWFNEGIKEKAGFVKYCIKLENGYRVGIELDGKHVKTLDEETELFLGRLGDIEKRCADPEEKPEDLLRSVTKAMDDVLTSCAAFERTVKDRAIVRDAQIRFREKTNPVLSKSFCINRVRTWPQGHQGDYKTLEYAYRNTPMSEGIGYYLDLYFLNVSLAGAVRNRIEKLKSILKDELAVRKQPSVLNIACGSCREVFELAQDIEKSGAKFTCFDLDNDALAFAANRFSYTNISPLVSDQVVLRKYNAIRMFDNELNTSEFGKQDIIYSVGFFDYMQSDFLSKLFKALYNLLNPGGLLITSFKDAARYRSQEYHWIADWDGFLQRNEGDFMDILHNAHIPFSSISEVREESGIIVFYLAKK